MCEHQKEIINERYIYVPSAFPPHIKEIDWVCKLCGERDTDWAEDAEAI